MKTEPRAAVPTNVITILRNMISLLSETTGRAHQTVRDAKGTGLTLPPLVWNCGVLCFRTPGLDVSREFSFQHEIGVGSNTVARSDRD
jgi:hypothetical protein